MKNLSSNKEILIEKPDKGKSVVSLYRDDYIIRMNEMLSDSSKFSNIDTKSGKEINYLLQLVDRLISFLLKTVKNSSSSY